MAQGEKVGAIFAELTLDTAGLQKAAAKADKTLAELQKPRSVAVSADTRQAEQALSRAAANAKKLSSTKAGVTVSANTKTADAAISGVSSKLKQLASQKHTISVGVDTGGAGAAAGLAGGFLNADKAAQGLVGTIKTMATTIAPALAAGAALSTVFEKGMSRLTAIDSAQSKLKGLGHDAAGVSKIMESALAAVKGTAFGLGEAASTAANAVASGIKPGQELTSTLKTIADTAAIAGGSMSEIGLIFNSVAARGKLQGDDMLQLLSRGVPVLQLLAKQTGKTASEISDMVSKGTIDFKTFRAAMEAGMGGGALAMGQSFKGAMDNAAAAVGRLGAELLNPAFKAAPNILAGFTSSVDDLTNVAKTASSAWQSIPAPIQAAAGALAATAIGMPRLTAALANTDTRLGAAAAGFRNLRTEIAGLQASGLNRVQATISTIGSRTPGLSNLQTTFRVASTQAQLFAAQMTASSTVMQRFGAAGSVAAVGVRTAGTAAGVAAVGFGALRTAASGLLAALGGPFGIAIAGATALLTVFMQHSAQAKQKQQEAAQATKDWTEAFKQSHGAIDQAIAAKVGEITTNEKLAASTKKAGLTVQDTTQLLLMDKKARDEKIQALKDEAAALEKNDKVARSAYDVKNGDGKDRAKAAAIRETIAALEAEAQAMDAGKAAATQQAAATEAVAEAQKKLAEGSSIATQNNSTLNSVMGALSAEAKTADEAIKNLARSLAGMTANPAVQLEQSMGDFYKSIQDIGKGGAVQPVAGGGFDQITEQGRAATQAYAELQYQMAETIAETIHLAQVQGSDLPTAFEQGRAKAGELEAALDKTLQGMGYLPAQIDQIKTHFGLIPERIVTAMQMEGVEQARAAIESVADGAFRLDGQHQIWIDASQASQAQATLDQLGLKLTETQQNGRILVDVKDNSDKARYNLDTLKAVLNGDKWTIGLDADTQKAVDKLNEVGIKASNIPPAQLDVYVDSEALQQQIEQLGLVAQKLPGGQIYIENNTDEVRQKLESLGIQTAGLPGGNIVVDDNTGNVLMALEALGVKVAQLPGGRVMILDNAAEVRAKVDRELAPSVLNKVGTVTLNVIRTIRDVFSPGHSATGGIAGRARGGRLPKHSGGYRLPTSGPGTSRTDGILGVTRDGTPISWVDAGEWIINRRSSKRYNKLLEAINQGDNAAIRHRVLNDLPAHAEGGIASGGNILSGLKSSQAGAIVLTISPELKSAFEKFETAQNLDATALEEVAQKEQALAAARENAAVVARDQGEKIHDAEVRLAKARQDGKPDQIAEAEKDLQFKRDDAARKNRDAAAKVTAAEQGLADATAQVGNIAQTVAASQFTAFMSGLESVIQVIGSTTDAVFEAIDSWNALFESVDLTAMHTEALTAAQDDYIVAMRTAAEALWDATTQAKQQADQQAAAELSDEERQIAIEDARREADNLRKTRQQDIDDLVAQGVSKATAEAAVDTAITAAEKKAVSLTNTDTVADLDDKLTKIANTKDSAISAADQAYNTGKTQAEQDRINAINQAKRDAEAQWNSLGGRAARGASGAGKVLGFFGDVADVFTLGITDVGGSVRDVTDVGVKRIQEQQQRVLDQIEENYQSRLRQLDADHNQAITDATNKAVQDANDEKAKADEARAGNLRAGKDLARAEQEQRRLQYQIEQEKLAAQRKAEKEAREKAEEEKRKAEEERKKAEAERKKTTKTSSTTSGSSSRVEFTAIFGAGGEYGGLAKANYLRTLGGFGGLQPGQFNPGDSWRVAGPGKTAAPVNVSTASKLDLPTALSNQARQQIQQTNKISEQTQQIAKQTTAAQSTADTASSLLTVLRGIALSMARDNHKIITVPGRALATAAASAGVERNIAGAMVGVFNRMLSTALAAKA